MFSRGGRRQPWLRTAPAEQGGSRPTGPVSLFVGNGNRRQLPVGVVLPILLAIVYWPFPETSGTTSVDDSWRIALHVAVAQGFHWGSDIAFTHGPLGFLGFAVPYVGPTSTLATLASFAVYAGLGVAIYHRLRDRLPGWVVLVVLVATARSFVVIPAWEAVVILAFVVATHATSMPPVRGKRLASFAVCWGVASAICVLGKFNVGVFVGAIGVISVSTLGRPRSHGPVILAGAFSFALIVLWTLARQSPGDLFEFVADSLDLTRGYSDAMSLQLFPIPLLLEALFLTCVAAIGIAFLAARKGRDGRQDLVVLALGTILSFALWKASFVRADTHVVVALVAMPLAAAVVLVDRFRWQIVLLSAGAVLLVSQVIGGISPLSYLDGRQLMAALGQASTILPGHGEAAANLTRETLRSRFALEEAVLVRISGRNVAIDPWDISIPFAYPEILWTPTPPLQSYVAYTQRLDSSYADFLASARAPDRILRGAGSTGFQDFDRAVDGRNYWYEAPSALLQMLCRYREIVATERWQVLALTESTCGDRETISVVVALAGETVSVPREIRPDRFVVVEITGFDASPLDAARSLLWKGTEWYITVDETVRFRLVTATAADGLLLGVPPEMKGTPPFAFGGPTRTLKVGAGRDQRASQATLTYRFVSVPWLGRP